MTRRISAKEARSNFSDLSGSIRYSGDPVIVEKKGRPFAVMISPEDFERFQRFAKDQFLETVRKIQQDNKDADPDEVLRDVTDAVEAVRQEEYERKPGVVLDTNLFVSAFISPTGTPSQLLHLWERGRIILLTSSELIDEIDSVLHRASIQERYGLAEGQISTLLTRLHLTAEWVVPRTPLPMHSRDPKDDTLLAFALGGNAVY